MRAPRVLLLLACTAAAVGAASSAAAVAAAPATASSAAAVAAPGWAPEPWAPLSGVPSGRPAPLSPDPLVAHEWPGVAPDPLSALEVYAVPAVACGPAPGTPAGAFVNVSSAVGSLATAITVAGNGTLVIDFGVELPAWVEFDSPDLTDAGSVSVCISEYTACGWMGDFKRGTPKPYCGAGGCTYRLETNAELYEGVRYAFITLRAPPAQPWTITGLRAMAQTKLVNYTGHFSAPGDPLLETVWYTGAYTVRATLQQAYMGSILMDRGDRFSWTGDAHPSQATALAAFSRFDIVFNNLNRSKADCQGIATYCLYFVLSVHDYYEASGDSAGVTYLTPNVQDHLEQAASMWANPQGLRFVGWDDRLGSGFANNTTPETQALYRLLAIRAWTAAAGFLAATGSPALAARYAALAANRTRDMRASGGGSASSPAAWYSSFGLHASAEAVTAGFLTPAEAAGVAAGDLGDVVVLPSQSQFNQYFILQALALLGQLDRGVECIALVWGSIVQAGATTFWETSHPSAVDLWPSGPSPPPNEQSGWVSYAHPWASGPTPWLTRWVAGLRPLEPGYARVLVAPHVAHRMRGVGGAVGTPHGVVTVSARGAADGGDVGDGGDGPPSAVVTVTLPAGVRSATLRLTAVTLGRLLALAEPPPLHAVELALGGTPARGVRVTVPADGPLLDEAAVGGARASALELELPGGSDAHVTHTVTLRVRAPAAGGAAAEAAAAPPLVRAWAPAQSPFPPPAWPGAFVGSDATTGGSWLGRYGKDGYALLAYDAPPADPFCGADGEGSTLQLRCDEPGATITSVRFASYGTPTGSCPAYGAGACAAPGAQAVVAAACEGVRACSVPVTNAAFGGDPCPGTPKSLAVVAHCSSGGGSQPDGAGAPPADRVRLPPYVASVTAQTPATTGFCAARFVWTNGTADARALQDPDAGPAAPRHLGYVQPCGCPTAPIDVALKAGFENQTYVLSAYFVDYAPSAGCGAFDGTARSQEVYLLTGYPRLNPAAPRQALSAFGGGMWLSWRLQGDVRVRISTVSGDMAVLSALMFD